MGCPQSGQVEFLRSFPYRSLQRPTGHTSINKVIRLVHNCPGLGVSMVLYYTNSDEYLLDPKH
eukprot:scaffold45579_cov197-Skeletonema_marinoi.AAC.2